MDIDHLPRESGIYRITCTANGKFYIGSAVNIRKRLSGHKRGLLNMSHRNKHLQRISNKYGVDSLEVSVLQLCHNKDLITTEQHYIDTLLPVINICLAAGSSLGVKRSEETKAKMSLAKKGMLLDTKVLYTLTKLKLECHRLLEAKNTLTKLRLKFPRLLGVESTLSRLRLKCPHPLGYKTL